MQKRLLVLRHVLTAYAGLFLLSRAPVAHAQSPTPATSVQAIKCGRLLDVRTGRALPNGVVLVRGRTILQAGAAVVDLSNALVLPGLIDAHPHLRQNYQTELGDDSRLVTVASMSTARRVLLGAAMSREDLEASITTMRDLGNSGVNGDVALREAINQGDVVGARMVASTRALAAGGQFGHLTPEAPALVAQEYVAISGVEEARRAVRAPYDGADCIKAGGHNMLTIRESTQQAPSFSNQHTNSKVYHYSV
ncbi:amidohydrolase family protein [Hymenobacter sp. BT664]|uniref:Amidohydrolase family protein n=1 Tax=Hymenobacter montanus TaxID=2771359 RepID=A0A927B8W6_9BACT|nr:amidohydrolase family protein [Hymenobacter montanus]MBD2766282.1 amidohydrolase family protein [Hymenobacter montanus]